MANYPASPVVSLKKGALKMPSTQLQHCLHCKSVYPHKVIVEEHNKHSKTKIVHLICKNCNKCTSGYVVSMFDYLTASDPELSKG